MHNGHGGKFIRNQYVKTKENRDDRSLITTISASYQKKGYAWELCPQ